MATALDMIKSAMRKIGALESGEVPSPEESADGLALLNTMLDAWAIERLMVYLIVQSALVWPAATPSRTIGAGGNFNQARPEAIDSAFSQDAAGVKLPIKILTERSQYDTISVPTTQSTIPDELFYDRAYPLGVLYLFPVPSAQITLLLNTWQILQAFGALNTQLALPRGYQRAIEFNLACEWASEFGLPVPVRVATTAASSRKALERINAPSPVMSTDPALLRVGPRYDINTDGYR